ncbi:TlyA family RNA methyltransferase [Merismopedia glauca]|uniref:TlyA family rRNA (Cytidine-2'-O)-methyltransferase n=1 Tax=Merismopedia glauca CCAP 1448/3 TaxID=1296344 RepID=A0A2T1BZA3_9CYAN|nr:TlyA family RNA methyltransferase [Merismopedia glauca]PSB01349.1 TlyA family rRNA (cytidine-2'-O)-methyltransferase [Merismopedia glauca CCAP 1448/3]
MSKQRLDTLLVEKELCTSRQQAQGLIRAGLVLINQQIVDKPGTEVNLDALITIKQRSPYVSRGGEKLAKALQVFDVSISNRICLDGGISTGGFTDCLLQAGAKLVYGIDVGYGQLDWRLRNDERVIVRERTNLRYLKPEDLYGNSAAQIPDLGVVDVSFISLNKILPALVDLLIAPKELILLVKPQFEVGREQVGKKGVVRDSQVQAGAIAQVLSSAIELGWGYRGLTWSPLVGPAGNIEYLLWLSQISTESIPDRDSIDEITDAARQCLSN